MNVTKQKSCQGKLFNDIFTVGATVSRLSLILYVSSLICQFGMTTAKNFILLVSSEVIDR